MESVESEPNLSSSFNDENALIVVEGKVKEGTLKSDEEGEIADEDQLKLDNIAEAGLGSFIDCFKDHLADHAAKDISIQYKDKKQKMQNHYYNEEEEKRNKEKIIQDLEMEHLKNQGLGLPTKFESRKEQAAKNNIRQAKGKNIERIQKYYGDIYDEYDDYSSRRSHRRDYDYEDDFVEDTLNKPPIPELVENLGKNDFYCEVCEIRMNGIQSFQSHIKGSKHYKKLKKLQESKLAPDYTIKPETSQQIEPQSKPPLELRTNIEQKLSALNQPLIGVQFIIEYFFEGDKQNEPKYVCELCDKKCDFRTLEFHLESYIHRWSYIKLKYPYYATEIREYGPKKMDRNDAMEKYASKIEYEEGYPRKIKTSMIVSSEKVLTMEDAARASAIEANKKSMECKVKMVPLKPQPKAMHQFDRVNEFLKQASADNSWQTNNDPANQQFANSAREHHQQQQLLQSSDMQEREELLRKQNERDEEDDREFREYLMFKKFKTLESLENSRSMIPQAVVQPQFQEPSQQSLQFQQPSQQFSQQSLQMGMCRPRLNNNNSYFSQNIPINGNQLYSNQVNRDVIYNPNPNISPINVNNGNELNNNMLQQQHPMASMNVRFANQAQQQPQPSFNYREPQQRIFNDVRAQLPNPMMNRMMLSPSGPQNVHNNEINRKIDSFINSLKRKNF